MLFKPRQKKYCLDIQLLIDNECIEQLNETMFLGVILDENLSWKSHLSYLANKISKSIGVIYKASFCLPLESLRILYLSMIYPYLQYCAIVWGLTYPTSIRRIEILQKRAIRILDNSASDAHLMSLLSEQISENFWCAFKVQNFLILFLIIL